MYQLSKPSPTLSIAANHAPRLPSRRSLRASWWRVSVIPVHRSGSGGNGIGLERTIFRDVRSVARPSTRSSAVAAAKCEAPTPSPVKPTVVTTRPPCERSQKAQNREQVSITPPGVTGADALELREHLQQVFGEQRELGGLVFMTSRVIGTVVVERVPAAEQNPIVGGQAEVMEAWTTVGQTLAPGPTQRCPTLGVEGLGHQA